MAFAVLLYNWTTFGGQNKIRVETPTTDAIIEGLTISFDGGATFVPYTYNGLGTKNDGPNPRPSGEFITVGGSRYVFNADDPTGTLPTGNWNINASNLNPSNPPCFLAGTLILTPDGERPVEELSEGDKVVTVSGRVQPVIWVGGRHIPASVLKRNPEIRPIRIAAGAIGNDRDLIVSPQHRILVTGAHAEVLFGEKEVLVPAKGLLGGDRVHYCDSGSEVAYYHLLLGNHDVLLANGVAAESLYLGDQMGNALFRELELLIPNFEELRGSQSLSHPALSVKEARALM